MTNIARSHWMIILLVIVNYALLTYTSYTDEKFSKTPVVAYQYLTEAFLDGRTSFSVAPPKELLALQNPYSYKQNFPLRLNKKTYQFEFHDISLYKGSFYSYFGPLPVVAFFLPFKALTGYYPPTYLAVFFFLSLGFIISYLLMIRIKVDYFPSLSEPHLMLVGLLLGFATNAPFLLARPIMYEAAIASAFCFMILSLYFLYFIVQYHSKIRYIVLFSFCLALTVAGRPHFMLACVFITPVFLYYLYRSNAHHKWVTKMLAFMLPALMVACALAAYNYFRFGSVLEFGLSYQLGCIPDDISHSFFTVKNMGYRMMVHLYYYFFHPYDLSIMPPWVMFHFPYGPIGYSELHIYENTAGMLLTTPILLFLLPSPWLTLLYMKRCPQARSFFWYILLVGLMTLVLVFFLLMISFMTQRYVTDIQPYLVILSILSFWLMKGFLNEKMYQIANTIFIVMALFSIYAGMCLGFSLQRDLLSLIEFKFNCYGVHFFWIMLNFWLIYQIFQSERNLASYLIVKKTRNAIA